MGIPVTYYCPHCGTFAELERDGYLADKAVTPYPLEGWTYAAPDEPFEGDDVDGVRFVCGESDGVRWSPAADDGVADAADPDGRGDGGDRVADPDDPTAPGCGEPFYLSFVRYEEGREIDPRAETELVEIDPDPRSGGPQGPDGPGSGGFW